MVSWRRRSRGAHQNGSLHRLQQSCNGLRGRATSQDPWAARYPVRAFFRHAAELRATSGGNWSRALAILQSRVAVRSGAGQTHQNSAKTAGTQEACNAKARKRGNDFPCHGACLEIHNGCFWPIRGKPTQRRPHSGCSGRRLRSFRAACTSCVNGSKDFDAFALLRTPSIQQPPSRQDAKTPGNPVGFPPPFAQFEKFVVAISPAVPFAPSRLCVMPCHSRLPIAPPSPIRRQDLGRDAAPSATGSNPPDGNVIWARIS